MSKTLFLAQGRQDVNQLLDWCHVGVMDSSVLKIIEKEENTWNSVNLFLHIICVICDNNLIMLLGIYLLQTTVLWNLSYA